jgi:hypothetical protein
MWLNKVRIKPGTEHRRLHVKKKEIDNKLSYINKEEIKNKS